MFIDTLRLQFALNSIVTFLMSNLGALLSAQ